MQCKFFCAQMRVRLAGMASPSPNTRPCCCMDSGADILLVLRHTLLSNRPDSVTLRVPACTFAHAVWQDMEACSLPACPDPGKRYLCCTGQQPCRLIVTWQLLSSCKPSCNDRDCMLFPSCGHVQVCVQSCKPRQMARQRLSTTQVLLSTLLPERVYGQVHQGTCCRQGITKCSGLQQQWWQADR